MKNINRRQFQTLVASATACLALSPFSFSRTPNALENPMTESPDKPSPPGIDPSREQMIMNLRKANEVARQTMATGAHPFGAILVAADHETVLMEQGNINTVNHAESTLARLAADKFSADELWGCTLYTTAEPCAMCAGTQYWANIGRMVYGMSEEQLLELTGNHEENPTLDVPSRYIFAHSQKNIRVWGPIDEVVEEIAELHLGFWK